MYRAHCAVIFAIAQLSCQNFFTTAFSRKFTIKRLQDFAYEIGEKVSGLDDSSLWILHQGKRKVVKCPKRRPICGRGIK